MVDGSLIGQGSGCKEAGAP